MPGLRSLAIAPQPSLVPIEIFVLPFQTPSLHLPPLQSLPQHTGSEPSPDCTHGSTWSFLITGHGLISSVGECESAALKRPGPALSHSFVLVWFARSSPLPSTPHTCQPAAHTSAGTVHFSPSSPHGLPVGLSRKLLLPAQLPTQPAMRGFFVASANASR